MSATDETATVQPGAQPDAQPGETYVLTVEAAADVLGISPQAVRKRIQTGKLPARKEGRSWIVFLDAAARSATGATDATATGKPDAQPPSQPVAHAAQPQAAQLAALVEPFTRPLVERIEALSREAERERGRADTAEAERDAALAEVEQMRAEADAPELRKDGPGTADGGDPAPRPRPWWRRLLGG